MVDEYVGPEEIIEDYYRPQIPHPDITYVPDLRSVESDIVDASEAEMVLRPQRVARKPKPAQRKPRKTVVPGVQEFYPRIPDPMAQQPTFRFETTPFRITDKQRADLSRGPTASIRGATTAEIEQARKAEERELAVSRRREGPTLWGLVDPMRELGEAHQTLTYETPNVFLRGLASMPEGAAELSRTVGSFLGGGGPSREQGPASPTLRRFTNYMEESIEDAFPTDQRRLSPVSQTLGSAAQFIIPGKLLTKLGVPANLTSGVLGATMNTQQIAREMEGFKDVSPERRDAAIAMAAVTGLSEMVGLGRVIDKFGLRQQFARRLLDIAEEGGQEVLQQWLNNLNAKVVGAYDKKRPLTKDLFMSFMMGTMGGAMFQGMGMAAERDRNRAPGTPPPPAQRWTPVDMQATQMELPFPPDVEQVPVPRPELPARPEVERPLTETDLKILDETGYWGEWGAPEPGRSTEYGEDLGVKKVGKRGRRPAPKSIMPTEEQRLLDVEGGIEIPIASKEEMDAPIQFPLDELLRSRLPKTNMDNTDPMTGLPLGAADMRPQDSLDRREDNLLEFLRESQAFTPRGNPIIGYLPSRVPTETNTLDPRDVGSEVGENPYTGIMLYQDPAQASLALAKNKIYPRTYEEKETQVYKDTYNRVRQEKEAEARAKGKEPYEWSVNYEAENAATDAARQLFKQPEDRSSNIRPYYFDVRNTFDLDRIYGPDEIAAIREALREERLYFAYNEETRQEANDLADNFLRNEEDIMRDHEGNIEGYIHEIDPVTGLDIVKALSPGYKYENMLQWTPMQSGTVRGALERAGYDGLTYVADTTQDVDFKTKQGYEEFDTLKQAEDYADKTGGTLGTEPILKSEEIVSSVTGEVLKPAEYSKRYTVTGSKIWHLWKGTALKSATGNTGDFDPNRPEVWASATPQGWQRADTSSDTLAFDVMPAMTEGQAPYLRLPQWAMNAITKATNFRGYNIVFSDLNDAIKAVRKAAPDEAHAEAATNALLDLAVQSKIGSNISSLSLVSNEGNEEDIRGVIEHEVFHAAQREGAIPDAQWLVNHPVIQKVIQPGSFFAQQYAEDTQEELAKRAAIEILPHTIQGKLGLLGLSSAEGIDFMMDYYTYMMENYGKASIDKIKRISGRMRPEMVEALDLAESMWTGWQAMREGTSGVLGSLGAAEPTIEIDSVVRSKSRGKTGVVVNMGTDEDGRWAEVRFPDGTSEELYLKDLSITAAPKTPKVPNKTKAQDELKKTPVISVMGSGQMFLPGMEGSRKDVVAAPAFEGPPAPPNIPVQMSLPGMEAPQFPPVMVPQVSNVYNQAVDQAFTALLEANGVRFNPANDVFLQVADAIAEGKIDGQRFQEALAENGLTREQFVERFKNTASDSARTLAYLSHVKQRWLKALAKNENLKDVLFTPSELFEMLLKDINNTELGMSLWQRASTIIRMLMLSDLHTAAVNSIMTVGRIPLAIGVHGGGAWLKTMADGRAQGKTLAQNLNDATDASLDAMRAGLEVALVLNPVDIAKAAIGKDSRQGHHEFIVNELFKAFPDLKHKLKDPGIGTDKPAELGNMLTMAEKIVEDIRTKPAREKALTELKVYQKRFNSNVEGIGELLKGMEIPLDWILTPMRWQEWFFRRPMFVGYLDLALRRRHQSLEDMVRDGTLKEIPEEILEEAIDEALDFTYAYMPKIDGPGFEKAAYHLIKGVNEMKGASSLIGTMFPRAIYNGMKFTYEYSPMGALPGLKKMLRPEMGIDPNDQKEYRQNPLTRKDYDRFAKATLGTIMFTGALSLLKFGLMGDEWWQIKTGRKHPDGRPIYLDIRRYQPFATFYRLADLTDRLFTSSGVWEGDRRLGDLQFGKELKETLTGLRSFPGVEEYISAVADMWADGDTGNVEQKALSSVGVGFSFLTRPFINLRHAVAMFDEDENKRRDIKGTGILGPLVDNIPWVRRLLPEYQSITEPSPPQIYQDPELLFVGAKYTVGEGYAGREWRRLGLLNRRFMPPDPNPKINRLQNEFFRNMIYDIGQAAESDPSYQQLNDVDRAAYWERMARKIAPRAAKFGLTADPKEAVKRKVREKANVGELQYKAMGLDKMLQDNATKPDQQEIERLSRQAVQ